MLESSVFQTVYNLKVRVLTESTFSEKLRNNYLPKFWKVLFSKQGFIEIFFSSTEVRASAKIVGDESRFGNRTLGK